HDACAVAYLIDPTLFVTKEYYVQIETRGTHTLGATVADRYNIYKKPPNVKALMGIDREGFIALLTKTMNYYLTTEGRE
ncbi:MAG: pyrimidine-specific ribonucleoside hydrolase RihA, partial [Clostridiales bacterium]|nr:pyrimidine-specific ribonucleoside hydrolase RihA [Clostridiales bacterium]